MKPLQVVVAIDSFKGSATSLQAATWVSTGLKRANANMHTIEIPIADGGEGTVVALTAALNGKMMSQQVTGPLGQAVVATWGWLPHHQAVIEMAEASGLQYTHQTPVEAMKASTIGVGELIKAAIQHGATTLYVGLGGSATTDGGVGMARALGYEFYDQCDQPIASGAAGLATLTHIDATKRLAALDQVQVIVLSDVSNPLAGQAGAAQVFGAQKGLTASQRLAVDRDLARFGQLLASDCGQAVAELPGAGAAGGLGAGLLAFAHAQSQSGIESIMQLVGLADALPKADLVITGEGHLDAQSIRGKAPIGIAKAAKQFGLPVIALVGARSVELDDVYQNGIDAVLPIGLGPQSLTQAMAEVKTNLITAGETAMRLFLLAPKQHI